MQLPPHVDVDVDAIKERHNLDFDRFTPLKQVGIFNAVYLLGDELVLRVPRDHAAFVAAARKEAVAVPAARAAGVRTPAIVAADDSCDLVPVPYAIYERVRGETLEVVGADPLETGNVWRDLGRDLALLHAHVPRDGAASGLECEDVPDPRAAVDGLATSGHVSSVEARWLENWLATLAPAAETQVQERFVHGDTQASNVIVDGAPPEYVAVLDWGGCGWGDPARDFAGIPLRGVPFVLEGYREQQALDGGDTLEARIVWRHLQLALFNLPRGPQPGLTWAERPFTMLLDIMRFFAAAPPSPWRELGPPSAPAGEWRAWNG